jgi:ribosomal protein S18 acetylase RimI-like enzyme
MIRALQKSDYDSWLKLWDGNNLGQRNEEVTALTWKRIHDPASPVFGLCAVEDGIMTGICHYVLHPATGSLKPICYMQDLYIDPAHRRKGIARALVTALAEIGQREQWSRMYWLAESSNTAAQNFYENIGVKLDFTLHVLPLGKI